MNFQSGSFVGSRMRCSQECRQASYCGTLLKVWRCLLITQVPSAEALICGSCYSNCVLSSLFIVYIQDYSYYCVMRRQLFPPTAPILGHRPVHYRQDHLVNLFTTIWLCTLLTVAMIFLKKSSYKLLHVRVSFFCALYLIAKKSWPYKLLYNATNKSFYNHKSYTVLLLLFCYQAYRAQHSCLLSLWVHRQYISTVKMHQRYSINT